MHLCARPPRPSVLWPDIPKRLEALLLKLLAKDPAERATLAEVRATLAALRPTVTQSLDRVADAPPPVPGVRPRRHRHVLGLAVVAVTFLALAIAGYRPAKLHAEQGAAATEGAAPVTIPQEAASPTVAARAALVSDEATPPSHRATRRYKRPHRDANYLLDPFKH